MRTLSTVGAMALAALMAGGCSGCSVLSKAASPTEAVWQGQKIDEQAMGAIDALGSSANYLILAAVKSGALNRPQLTTTRSLRRDLDAAHAAALAAYRAGDARTFSEKLAAITELSNRAQALYDEVTK